MKACNYKGIEHPVIIIPRDDEILIATPEGQEIASLKVETMETDVEEDGDGWTTKATQNYWLVFHPKSSSASTGNAAEVCLGEPITCDAEKLPQK